MQVQAQPFLKLVQSNMALMAEFSTSPEVTSQATANAGQFLQQASGSAMKLMYSGAFAKVLQGMMKNYSEFLMEVGQGTVAMMNQGQAAMLRQAQDAAEDIADGTQTRGRRSRSA